MNQQLIAFLIAIKNAYVLKRDFVRFFFNKKLILLSKLLYKEGLIQDFWLDKNQGSKIQLVILLKCILKFSNSFTLKVISKPSRIFYFSYLDMLKLYEKQSLFVFSTAFGYLTSIECKRLKIGGVLFFYVK